MNTVIDRIETDGFENLRETVRKRADELGLSSAKIANACGVPSSTLSEFMNGKDKGDKTKTAEKLENWLQAQEAKKRALAIRPAIPGFLLTKTAETLMNIMESAQYDVDLALIAGNAGLGKTMAAEAYRAQNNNVWIITADPSMASPSAVLNELCTVLACAPSRGISRINAIIRRLHHTEGLIIVDEAQNLSVRAIEELRSIHDRASIGIVFIGNAPLNAKFDGFGRNDDFAQLFSRIGLRKNILKPLKTDIATLLDAWAITDAQVRNRAIDIARNSGGLRIMTKILRNASRFARTSGRELVTEPDIEAAWVNHMTGELPKMKKTAHTPAQHQGEEVQA